jgi:hypothetical protein
MRKTLFFILLFTITKNYSQAQWLPLDPIISLQYGGTSGYKNMVIIDSTVFAVRAGGLEEINTTNNKTDYHWENYYQIRSIVADTGNTYVYLTQNNYIGHYNSDTQSYENIWAANSNISVNDIDVAPDGKVWAATSNGFNGIAVFDGINWDLISVGPNISGGVSKIKIINDTLAYVQGWNGTFYEFHNGIFDSIYTYTSYYLEDWDVDINRNLWIAATSDLIHIYNGSVTIYNNSNTPIGSDQFLHVSIGNDGHVWASGNSTKLLELIGTTWDQKTTPNSIENFYLNSNNMPWVLSKSYLPQTLQIYNYGTWTTKDFPFMPLKNIHAMVIYNYSMGQFATDGGFFNINLDTKTLSSFYNNNSYKHADDITCFTDNTPSYNFPYGSHHGVNQLYGFNNALLPDSNINYMCHDNGTYYIATDSGLVVYNGIIYNTLNTSNSPLPSNKITFVTTSNLNPNYDYTNSLYVGTDKGIAIYSNAQWHVFDTTNIPVDNFYVTGALKYGWGPDTIIYISTLGSGLIKANFNGSYEILNTANENFQDDTLYYVKVVELGECGTDLITGTSHHGIAYTVSYEPDVFNYITNYSGASFSNSKLLAISQNSSVNIISTDSLFYLLWPCGSIPKVDAPIDLKWYQQDNQLTITIPENFKGNGTVLFYDMTGKCLINESINSLSEKIRIDISHQTSGIYLLRLINNKNIGYSKISISKN